MSKAAKKMRQHFIPGGNSSPERSIIPHGHFQDLSGRKTKPNPVPFSLPELI